MSSKTVRFVNLRENANEEWLKSNILLNVKLSGKIEQVHVRKCESLNLVYAYVIFESDTDPFNTVVAYTGSITSDNRKLDVSLIGPYEIYTKYRPIKMLEEDYCVQNVDTDYNRNDGTRSNEKYFQTRDRHRFVSSMKASKEILPPMRGDNLFIRKPITLKIVGTKPRTGHNMRRPNDRPPLI